MDDASATGLLLAPTRLGRLDLRNRLAVAPLTRTSATADGVATAQMREAYRRWAAGGFGLLVFEGTYYDDAFSQGYDNQPGLVGEAQAEALAALVDAVHAEGAAIGIQLMHAGALVQGRQSARGAVAPSPIAPAGSQLVVYGGDGGYGPARGMTPDEIAALRDAAATAARRAEALGFDLVELHSANGYLLDQFLTSYANGRDDAYGGELRNRVRLHEELVRDCVAAVGDRIPIGVRLSQTKINDHEHAWEGGVDDCTVIGATLRKAGAGFLHVVEHPATREVFDSGRTLAALLREASALPMIACGGLDDPVVAAAMLERGDADIIALGRAAIANPDYPQRIRDGRPRIPWDDAILRPLATLECEDAWRAGLGASA
jgi:2,4-dienoyl-CoA reductase-like NADH-dependent reductase (Old Yellow Enzyme family)